MSYYEAERLYALLPAVYRRRDAEAGYPLKALVEILAREARVVEADIAKLYDNAFIETCDDWVVPYIGDLVGVRPLPTGPLRRDEVANTLGYRRRKGTAAVLELLAADVTGWTARAVEYFQRLAASQFLDHPRPKSHGTVDLRDPAPMERLHGPFDETSHTVDVRRIVAREGTYNLGNVGLWVWRLEAYPLHLIEPHAVDAAAGHYTFNPLGADTPLFHHPVTEVSATQLAGEVNVPEPIRRRQLAADLRADAGIYAGEGGSVGVYTRSGEEWTSVSEPLIACELGDWNRTLPPDVVAVDPERGRLVFSTPASVPEALRVSCYQGFSAPLGGGQYPRFAAGEEVLPATVTVGEQDGPATLAAALAAVQQGSWEGETRVVEIPDSRTSGEAIGSVTLPKNARLVLRAADQERPTVVLSEALEVIAAEGSELTLDGLLIAGPGLWIHGELNRLSIRHTTLVPGRTLHPDGTPAEAGQPSLVLDCDTTEATIEASVTGPLWVASEAETTLRDVVLDPGTAGGNAYAGADGTGYGGALRASRATVIGTVTTRALLLGENSLFLGPVNAERRQEGCVRYSWVAPGSRVPRRFHCQPPEAPAPTPTEVFVAPLVPRFVTLRYGRPAYAQLDWRGPAAILQGADDGSEMGAFSSLRQPQREAGLRQRLDEYLPVGLEAGVLFAT